MTLDQLRVFVAVAERQHVTQAAAALNIAQSAVSAAIASLEARHGARLFHRVGRGIELTEAGRIFLEEARGVLGRAEAAERVLAELGGLRRGTLSVYASQTIAGYWLPRHLAAFRRAHPDINIVLRIGNTAEVAAAIRSGAAELGFIEGAIDDTLLRTFRVATDQLVVVVGADHPWASAQRLDRADIEGAEWVLREPGSGTRSAFAAGLARLGLDLTKLNVVLELPSNEAVRAAVEAGLGATALSASVAAPSLEAGLLHLARMPIALPDRDFSVLHHTERPPSRAAARLLELIGADRPREVPDDCP
jgi:DNA-binding transcriptional LysR family regulator